MKTTPFAIGVAVMVLTSWFASPAQAITSNPEMQTRVETVLEQNPGGTQIAWNEVSWDDGEVVLTLAPPTVGAGPAVLAVVGGCTSGKFCAYNQTGYLGDKITYSTCTSTQSVANLIGAVRSIANSRTTGTIRAYAGSTLLASAAAGAGSNVTGTSTNISCS